MRERNGGFTLIELMVTVSIVVILATLAAPSMSSFVTSMRLTSASNQLYGDLNLARSEAIKRNYRVLVCPSSNGTSCATGTNWAVGWILCVDADSNGACDAITATTDPNYPNPFSVRPALDGNLSLSSTLNTVTFRPDGSSTSATLTLTSASRSKTLSLASTGLISRS